MEALSARTAYVQRMEELAARKAEASRTAELCGVLGVGILAISAALAAYFVLRRGQRSQAPACFTDHEETDRLLETDAEAPKQVRPERKKRLNELKGFRSSHWDRMQDFRWALLRRCRGLQVFIESSLVFQGLACFQDRVTLVAVLVLDIRAVSAFFQYSKWWGLVSLGTILLPYATLAYLLWPKDTRKLQGHPNLIFGLGWLPLLVGADLYCNLVNVCREPSNAHMFHYMRLRRILQAALESVPQLWLHLSVALLRAAPGSRPTSGGVQQDDGWIVEPKLLLAASSLAAFNIFTQLRYVQHFSELQTESNAWSLLERLARLGDGLAPSALLRDIERHRDVRCYFELNTLDPGGLASMARAVERSRALEQLCFPETSFLLRLHAIDPQELKESDRKSVV